MTRRNVAIEATCKRCGQTFYTTASTVSRYCAGCRPLHKAAYATEVNANLRVATTERKAQEPPAECVYCLKEFIPYRPTQVFCSDKCRRHTRQDEEHFEGLRRTTIGLEEGLCWICRKLKVKHLHSHHLMGHKAAPEPLVGLCPGCHQLVETLAARNFLTDEQAIEDLITLARFRRNLPDRHTVVKLLEEK